MLKKFWNWLTNADYVTELEEENARLQRMVDARDEWLDNLTKARNHFELAHANAERMVNFWFAAAREGIDATYRSFVQSMFVKAEGADGFAHGAMGLSGEAGEVLEIAKKNWVSGKPINRAHLIEEMGDVMFYWYAVCQNQGISPMEVVDANVRKLMDRYPPGTSALQPWEKELPEVPVLFSGDAA